MDDLIEFWPIIMILLGVVIWFIRLESKVLYLEDDRKNHWNKLDTMQGKLNEIAESLARLEGRLQNK